MRAPSDLAQAEEVGRLLATEGAVLLTGGHHGVMQAAARGSRGADGVSIGLMPGSERDTGAPEHTYLLPTGLGELRNGLLVRAADAVVAVGCSWGTLSEIALARRTGVPLVLLDPWELPEDVGVVGVGAADAVPRSAICSTVPDNRSAAGSRIPGMDTDIRDRLERSFGDGPAHPPVGSDLAAGRRALRRRRGATAAAACGGRRSRSGASYAVATLGRLRRHRQPGRERPEPPRRPPSGPPPNRPGRTTPRSATSAASWRSAPGVVVHEHLENPFGYRAPDLSDALDLTYEGHRMWVLAQSGRHGFGYSSSAPSNGWASFADWVADQTRATPWRATTDGRATVRLTDGGQVVAARGAEIVQRTDDPRLGADFAAPGTPTGAAVVTVAGDDRSFFVVWRVVDGRLDVITTPPGDVVGATFDELLTYARAQYASGEGLR